MQTDWFLVNLLKIFFLITSPVTFLCGIFLMYDINTYRRIEKLLARSYGFSKNVIVNLEKNRETFQMFLLKRRRIVGVICILNSLVAIFISLFSLKNY